MTSDVSLKLSCSLLLERLSAWLSAMKRLSKCRRHAQPEFEIDESRGRIVDLAFHDIKLFHRPLKCKSIYVERNHKKEELLLY